MVIWEVHGTSLTKTSIRITPKCIAENVEKEFTMVVSRHNAISHVLLQNMCTMPQVEILKKVARILFEIGQNYDKPIEEEHLLCNECKKGSPMKLIKYYWIPWKRWWIR